MASFKNYLRRSIGSVQDTVAKAVAMDPAPPRLPLTLFTLRSPEDLQQFATGCDADIGGYSTCTLDLGPDGRGRFWGKMSTRVHPRLEGKMNSGYAAFRSRVRKSLFSEMYFDVSRHEYLKLRVRGAGERRTQDAYFVNIQTETPVTSDIWQHRLFLRRPGEWEDVLIPFRKFVLTNYGQPVPTDMSMNTEKLRTIGISILGGKFNIQGDYELGIDSIEAVHDPPGMEELEERIALEEREKAQALPTPPLTPDQSEKNEFISLEGEVEELPDSPPRRRTTSSPEEQPSQQPHARSEKS